MLADTNQNAVSECESRPFFDIRHSLFNIRREVKRRYLLTCICYMLRRQIQNQKAVSECECELCFAIGHSLFDIRGEVGYLLDI